MDGPDTYSWEITYTRFDGTSRVDRGGGQFGSPEEVTGRVCRTFIEVGTALFDVSCDEITEQHYHDVLDALVEDRPEPGQPVQRVGAVIFDHEGAERMSLAAPLVYRTVSVTDVEDYREQLAEWDRRDAERRARRAKAAADAGRPSIQPLDPRLRGLISNLHLEADTVREEIFTPDHCREQLALAENTVSAATAARTAAEASGNIPEAAHAHAYIQRWQPRITRWASMLELTTEAYMDAAAVDAEAERLANIPPIED
ncbi:hypothetical protein [Nocardia macrotermitis]|uniref:Uncharacterized protein n=1 Tax=Nocardia macrotermitis TaxID=2585198 RepID=A0A7K0CVF8_9NOCA|nr:hypothetical protein [Nocardia macrotermitis]MQY17465.1 hypothetical protein [Nocardia macrotermitis]